MDEIGIFIKKRRKEVKVDSISDEIKKLPWYRRPLIKEEFITRKGKDNKFYVQHNEWHRTIWVGPYNTSKDAEDIIESYLDESQKAPLDKKLDSKIHSVQIEDVETFF